MKALVTGGAGFIGSQYVRALLSGKLPGTDDVQVTVLDKLTYSGNLENLADVATRPGYQFVQGDICDAPLVDEMMPGQDVIVHFAAESHVDRSIRASGTVRRPPMCSAPRCCLTLPCGTGVGRFVHVSTDEVYGSIGRGIMDGAVAAGAEFALLGVQGQLRPAGPRLSPHAWPGRRGDPMLQ